MRAALAMLTLIVSTFAHGASVARFQIVSGDRQIVVNGPSPSEPFVVRALDATGQPVAGLQVIIGPAADPGGPYLTDEFNFRGFNTTGLFSYSGLGFPSLAYLKITDVNGLASGMGSLIDFAPSSAPVGVVPYPGMAPLTVFSVVIVSQPPRGHPSVAVEFYHRPTHHYFVSTDDAEIAALDEGHYAGWSRSVGAFVVYRTAEEAPADALPVCRFFSPRFTSHFYSADPDECNAVANNWPDTWILETRNAFYVNVPDKASGTCAPGLQSVYRLFNNGARPNHRYVTDARLRDAMVAAGWISEGYGPSATIFCVAS